jgi:nitrous oxidase accessory protein NosD
MFNVSTIEVSNNTLTNMIFAGILAGSNCRIVDNFMDNNSIGIKTIEGNNITIVGNTITHSSQCAVSFDHAGSTQPNTAWSNNFINNSRQIFNYESPTNLNSDYPIGGNYWSDYNGTDKYSGPYQNESGSDGIGDTPYIPDNSTYKIPYPVDYYPLMHPIPESPSFLILPLFFITTLFGVIVYRKRLAKG